MTEPSCLVWWRLIRPGYRIFRCVYLFKRMFCSLVAETLRLHTLEFAWIGFSLMDRDSLAFAKAVVLAVDCTYVLLVP
jgi:hypothetical protein